MDINDLTNYRLCAAGDDFRLALSQGDDLPASVSGQPAAYFWKDVIAAGTYKHPSKGFTLDVDRKRLTKWAQTGKKMIAAGVAIPINCDHSDAARDCVGYVKDFKIDGDRLMAMCQLIGQDAPLLAARNQVSAGIIPDFTDGEGHHWGDAIVHVALTPVPVVPGQEPFVEADSQDKGELMLMLAREDRSSAIAKTELSRLNDLLAQKDRAIATLNDSVARATASAGRDMALQSFALKIDMALSRGAIDRATKDRLSELAAKADFNALTLSRQGINGGGNALALELADILLANQPISHGPATSVQILSRAIPGEIDSAMLNEFSKYMTAVANRR